MQIFFSLLKSAVKTQVKFDKHEKYSANFLRVPFFFLFQRLPQSPLLQLAPSVEHQSSAMLSILKRYSWHKFAIVTSHIGGHDDFIRAVRDQVLATVDFKYDFSHFYNHFFTCSKIRLMYFFFLLLFTYLAHVLHFFLF